MPYIEHLFKDSDIICLQETWYTKQDLKHVNNLYDSFNGIGVSTTHYSDGTVHGHPPGGVTIMSDVKLDRYVRI